MWSHNQQWKVTKYSYSDITLNYSSEVLVPYLSVIRVRDSEPLTWFHFDKDQRKTESQLRATQIYLLHLFMSLFINLLHLQQLQQHQAAALMIH